MAILVIFELNSLKSKWESKCNAVTILLQVLRFYYNKKRKKLLRLKISK